MKAGPEIERSPEAGLVEPRLTEELCFLEPPRYARHFAEVGLARELHLLEIPLARDAEGNVDIQATMQAITSVVESWVREHPEQWLWLHRRWR